MKLLSCFNYTAEVPLLLPASKENHFVYQRHLYIIFDNTKFFRGFITLMMR